MKHVICLKAEVLICRATLLQRCLFVTETRCQSVGKPLTFFTWWASQEAAERADRDLRTAYEQTALKKNKLGGKQSAGPWGKTLIRVLSYHESHNWIIHTPQLYSIFYLIQSRMWVWKQFFEVWKCWPLALETSLTKKHVLH